MEIEEELIFVLASRKRTRVVCFLYDVEKARGYEIADMLLMPQSSVSLVTKQLRDHKLVDFVQHAQARLFFLTDDGKKVVKKVRDYYGPI